MAAQQGLPMLMQPPPSPHPPPQELRALHNRARKAFAKRHYKRAAALYSSTLERCSRLKPWNTKPRRLLRTVASASGGSRATSSPASQ